MNDDVVLSSSSLGAYASCEYRWFLQYVETHPDEQTLEKAVGIGVHAVAQAYLSRVLEEGRGWTANHEWVTNLATSSFDMAYAFEVATLWRESEEDIRKMRDIGRRVSLAYVEDVGPTIEPLYVEHADEVQINGVPYSVHVDLYTLAREVLDLKVLAQKPRRGLQGSKPQLIGYALAMRAVTGEVESDYGLEVMVRLKRDRPYLIPVRNGGPVSDEDAAVFAHQLEVTANGIARQSFRPTGLEAGACRWCPVAGACDYWAEYSGGARD